MFEGLHNHAEVCNGCVMPNEAALITAKEKAVELGVSRSTLSRLVRSGEIVPAFRDQTNPRTGVMLFTPAEAELVAFVGGDSE
jgi:hypothetical protein